MNALEKYAAKQVLIEKLAIIAGAMRLGKKALYRASMKAEDLRRVLRNKEHFARKRFPRSMKGLDKVDENVNMIRAGWRNAKDQRSRKILWNTKDIASPYKIGLGSRMGVEAFKNLKKSGRLT